jgi:hypothetical protein
MGQLFAPGCRFSRAARHFWRVLEVWRVLGRLAWIRLVDPVQPLVPSIASRIVLLGLGAGSFGWFVTEAK